MRPSILLVTLVLAITLLPSCGGDIEVTTGDTIDPAAPAGLTATTISTSRIDLVWSASTDNVGVTGYRVYRDGAFLTTATGTGLSNTGLQPSTQYCYTVSAIDAAGNESAQTGSQCATTQIPDAIPPSTPANLTATAVSSGRIDLVWNAASDNVGVAGYRVYRDTSLFTTVAGTGFSNTGLAASTQYCYSVSAVDTSGNTSPPSSSQCATTMPPDTTPPSTPASLLATAVSSSRIDLSWPASTDNIGVTGYRVYRGASLITTVTGTGASDTGRAPLTQYCYTVSALDAAGNESAPTTSQCATTLVSTVDPTPPSVPAGLSLFSVSSSHISFEWTAATDNVAVTGYRIYRGGSLLTTVTATSGSDNSVSPLTTYCYAIAAVDAENNESGQSSALCATTRGSSSGAEIETNDTFVTAQTVSVLPASIAGTTQGNLDPMAPPGTPDLDYYTFSPSATQAYTITLSWSTPLIDLDLYLYDGSQTLIGSSLNGAAAEAITRTLQAGSTYFVKMSPYRVGLAGFVTSYTLTIAP